MKLTILILAAVVAVCCAKGNNGKRKRFSPASVEKITELCEFLENKAEDIEERGKNGIKAKVEIICKIVKHVKAGMEKKAAKKAAKETPKQPDMFEVEKRKFLNKVRFAKIVEVCDFIAKNEVDKRSIEGRVKEVCELIKKKADKKEEKDGEEDKKEEKDDKEDKKEEKDGEEAKKEEKDGEEDKKEEKDGEEAKKEEKDDEEDKKEEKDDEEEEETPDCGYLMATCSSNSDCCSKNCVAETCVADGF